MKSVEFRRFLSMYVGAAGYMPKLDKDGYLSISVFGPIRIEPRTSDPIEPEIGRIWLRTDL